MKFTVWVSEDTSGLIEGSEPAANVCLFRSLDESDIAALLQLVGRGRAAIMIEKER